MTVSLLRSSLALPACSAASSSAAVTQKTITSSTSALKAAAGPTTGGAGAGAGALRASLAFDIHNRQDVQPVDATFFEERRDAVHATLKDASVAPEDKQDISALWWARKALSANRCPSCWLNPRYCVCNIVRDMCQETNVTTPHKVHVWMHHKEFGSASNTGNLLCHVLGSEKSRLHLLGHRESSLELLNLLHSASASRPTLVLYPAPDAEPISRVAETMRENGVSACDLVVLDGTWGHARRMYRELPEPRPPHVHLVAFGTDGDADAVVRKPVFARGDARRKASYWKSTDKAYWQALAAGDAPTDDETAPSSLLAPVRMYRGPGSGRLCTLEACGIALRALDPDGRDGAMALDETLRAVLRRKVDRLLLQNGTEAVYCDDV